MKRMLTLLLLGGFALGAGAQSRKIDEAKRVVLGEENGSNDRRVYEEGSRRYPGTYPSRSSREQRVESVNREYNQKIQSVRDNRYLSRSEKDRMIRQLENDRNRRIREINNEYRNNDRNRRYNDRDNDRRDDDRRYDRRDNGKHKGWSKGKGHKKNKHRGHDDD